MLSALLVGFASGYLITAWLHGSIFSGVIAFISDGELQERPARWLGEWTRGVTQRLSELLLCPLCLSPYVCFGLHLIRAGGFTPLPQIIVATFASAAVSVYVERVLRK